MAAVNAFRLRKALPLFRRSFSLSSSSPSVAVAAASHLLKPFDSASKPSIQPSLFGGSAAAASFSSARPSYGGSEEIGPDTILFEGCDYNHWLITMDFPKDPRPSPEEMVRTYEETCAKGLGISLEEARRRMYACSTTTYQGFQAIMTEEESEKFRGIPGVVFILPDSYIDPVNKEYGGDKYENGVITPRPPPVQYRREGGRFRDRNRNPDQGGFNRPGGPVPNQQQNYGPPGSPQNFGAQQNYPQNYGTPGARQGYPQQSFGQPGAPRAYPQQNYGPPASGNYPPQQSYGPPGAPQNFPNQQNYGPPGGNQDPYNRRDSAPPPHIDYNQGAQATAVPPGQGYTGVDNRNYSPPHGGSFPQGNFQSRGQGTSNAYGSTSGYGQSYPGEAQRYPQMDQENGQGQQNSYAPTGHGQGRF